MTSLGTDRVYTNVSRLVGITLYPTATTIGGCVPLYRQQLQMDDDLPGDVILQMLTSVSNIKGTALTPVLTTTLLVMGTRALVDLASSWHPMDEIA